MICLLKFAKSTVPLILLVQFSHWNCTNSLLLATWVWKSKAPQESWLLEVGGNEVQIHCYCNYSTFWFLHFQKRIFAFKFNVFERKFLFLVLCAFKHQIHLSLNGGNNSTKDNPVGVSITGTYKGMKEQTFNLCTICSARNVAVVLHHVAAVTEEERA